MKPSALALLWPIAPPIAILLAISLYLLSGEVLYAHGSSMLLLLATALWGGMALLWELIAVPLALRNLLREPANKSRNNLLAVAAAATYIVGAFAYAWFLWQGDK